MVIEKDKFVAIHYTLTGDDGAEIDTSRNGNPLGYVHGNGYLIPGLEKKLEGKAAGDKITAVVQPEEGYGIYDDRLIATLSRERFDLPGDIEIGMQFQVSTPAGPTIVRVTKVDGDNITIDGNHELAGKTLHFDVEVVEVRDLTEDEKQQMLSGGCGGCGGGCGGNCGGGCGGDCGGDCGGNCEGGCGGDCNCK